MSERTSETAQPEEWWVDRPDSGKISAALTAAYEAFDQTYYGSSTAADLRRNAWVVVNALSEVINLTTPRCVCAEGECQSVGTPGCYFGDVPIPPGSTTDSEATR